ncbi:MAG: hypothetical protein R3E79_60565 [Caldilineaceae bacterium]
MKVIWDSQNEEKLYAINEDALYAQIKRKGKAVNRSLQRFEMVMIGVNVLVAIALIVAEFPTMATSMGFCCRISTSPMPCLRLCCAACAASKNASSHRA